MRLLPPLETFMTQISRFRNAPAAPLSRSVDNGRGGSYPLPMSRAGVGLPGGGHGRQSMLLYGRGSPTDNLSADDLRAGLEAALARLGDRRKVMILPPDFTRFHSRAGELTRMAWQHYGERVTDILPAIGTHFPMREGEIARMFGDIPRGLFRVHDWRAGVVSIGEVPGSFMREVSEGKLDYPWPVQVDRLLQNGGHDLILSIGQVVPHEVIGFASYNKNVFVGTGGAEGINKSHFLGAVYGMERIMGRADTPVRRVLNYGSEHFARHLPIVYVQTVLAPGPDGTLATRGLYIGQDSECFTAAAALSLQVNFQMLENPLAKVVVYLDPGEYKSTWLGNKSVYRTRMAIADGGDLVVLAPGLESFGEDKEIDRLVRKYGYVGTPKVLDLVARNDDMKANLSAAAHLIHGSSEGRFRITYCPGRLAAEEIRSVGFEHADLAATMRKYDPAKLRPGHNTLPGGEEVFFVPNPALGLWAFRGRFDASGKA
jgi:nickel-dependent lactate racemase